MPSRKKLVGIAMIVVVGMAQILAGADLSFCNAPSYNRGVVCFDRIFCGCFVCSSMLFNCSQTML